MRIIAAPVAGVAGEVTRNGDVYFDRELLAGHSFAEGNRSLRGGNRRKRTSRGRASPLIASRARTMRSSQTVSAESFMPSHVAVAVPRPLNDHERWNVHRNVHRRRRDGRCLLPRLWRHGGRICARAPSASRAAPREAPVAAKTWATALRHDPCSLGHPCERTKRSPNPNRRARPKRTKAREVSRPRAVTTPARRRPRSPVLSTVSRRRRRMLSTERRAQTFEMPKSSRARDRERCGRKRRHATRWIARTTKA